MRILIIKLAALGDVLRTTTVLPGLRRRYPACVIDWVTSPAACDLLRTNAFVDRVIDISSVNGSFDRSLYDLVISLDEDLPACELATSLRKHAKLVGAYVSHGRPTYSRDSAGWFDMSRISRYSREAANRLKRRNQRTYPELLYDMLDLPYERQEPVLALTPDADTFGVEFAASNHLQSDDVIFGVNAGAGSRWQDKRLGVVETVGVLQGLNAIPRARILLLGGPAERDRNRAIAERLAFPIVQADGALSLLDFAALVNLCRVLVTSDSLALHLALALQKPVVAFFYPTSAAEIEVYGRGIKIVGHGRSYCSYERVCRHAPIWDVRGLVESARILARA